MEEYLSRCVESIISQTFENLELILIDDGSTDNSLAICENFSEIDKRVRVIHQENMGVSVARNVGLECAHGEFVGFIDADDEATPQMYESMLNLAQAKKSDIVICDAMSVFPDGRVVEDDTISCLSESVVLQRCDLTVNLLKELAGSVWRCIYRTERIINSNGGIRFIQGMKISEDRVFNLAAFSRAERIFYEKKPLYKRYVLAESTVHRYHRDHYELVLFAYEKTLSTINKYWDESYYPIADIQFVEGIVGTIKNLVRQESGLSRREKIDELKRLCKNEVLINLLPSSNVETIIKYWIIHKWYFCLITMDTGLNNVTRKGTRIWMKFIKR